MARSRCDLVVMERGACREHQPICGSVDQTGTDEPRDRVEGVLAGRLCVGAVADKLIDQPRPLVIFVVQEPDQDAPVVAGVVLGCCLVTLFVHGSSPPVPGPGRLPPRRGHFD